MTLRSELLCAELLLGIVTLYLYNAAKRRDLFHIHLHKTLRYCPGVEIGMLTHKHNTQIRSLSKALPSPSPAPQHTLRSVSIHLLTCHFRLPKSRAPYVIQFVSATTPCVILNIHTHMHRTLTRTLYEHSHSYTRAHNAGTNVLLQSKTAAIPPSKRLSDDESERRLAVISEMRSVDVIREACSLSFTFSGIMQSVLPSRCNGKHSHLTRANCFQLLANF